MIECRFRPIPVGGWPAEFSRRRTSDQFSATWAQTERLLESEIAKLGADFYVIELALHESDIRIDGRPRARAIPRHPGAIVSFESKHGPLRYGTDAFPRWQSNVRAIALGLEALRRVDRYGIGKRGEQYVGWKQLGAGDGDKAQRGRELIAEHGGETAALKATHPDHGGDREDFEAVQAARGATR